MISNDPRTLREENRQLRFKLQAAERRIRELSGIETSTREELSAAFREECLLRGTTPEYIIATKLIWKQRPIRWACVKAVCDRFPHVAVSDLARFFGADRHFIYDVKRSEAQ